jgi:hypothetical protein
MILYLAWFFASVLIFYGTLNSKRDIQIGAMVVFLIALGIFIGLGDMLGGFDRCIYGELFDNMADATKVGDNPWTTNSFAFFGSEFGFGTLCALLSYITGNRYIFIFILTMIIYILLIISLCEHVDNAPFAVIMFMGLWVFFTFTYLRQVLGCAIVWLSVKYIIQRDLKRFLLVWFIGFSFHNSIIIFLPMYFLPIKKYSREKVIYFMITAFLIGMTPLPQGLFAVYGEIDADRVGVANYEADAGFRWAYFVESVFFLYLILMNYRNISRDKKNMLMLNMALVFCAILLIFIKSENGGRLGWMFMIGIFCTLSNICVKRKQLLLQGVLMMMVCFGLYYRVYNSWQESIMGLSPYKTFLTNGVREGDIIHEKYEYDERYDEDKFYRPALWWFGE